MSPFCLAYRDRATSYAEITEDLMDTFEDDTPTGPISIDPRHEERLRRRVDDVEQATLSAVADAIERRAIVAAPTVLAGLVRSGKLTTWLAQQVAGERGER
jgi:hypothetical protein